jgi:hypothetical protein
MFMPLLVRQATINEMSAQLAQRSRRTWSKPAAFALALMGTLMGTMAATNMLAVAGRFTRTVGTLFGGAGHEKQPDFGPLSFMFKSGIKYPVD